MKMTLAQSLKSICDNFLALIMLLLSLPELFPLSAAILTALPHTVATPKFALYPNTNWFGTYILQCIASTHEEFLVKNSMITETGISYTCPCYQLNLRIAESIKNWETYEEGRKLFHLYRPSSKKKDFTNPFIVENWFHGKLQLDHETCFLISKFVGHTLQLLLLDFWHKRISQEEYDARVACLCDPRSPLLEEISLTAKTPEPLDPDQYVPLLPPK